MHTHIHTDSETDTDTDMDTDASTRSTSHLIDSRTQHRDGTVRQRFTATHCNALQRTAAHCNTLQYTATHCNTLQHTAAHYSTLQHTATPCNTLKHPATSCNTLQHLHRRHAIEPVHESTSLAWDIYTTTKTIALLYCCTCTYGCLSSFLIKLGASLDVATVVYFVRVRHADDSQISVGWRCVCS